jgi:hypothetical protein
MKESRRYGEMKCPICNKIFFIKKLLDCHMGSHARGQIKPKCKTCKVLLTDKNWVPSLQKSQNLLCKKCLRERNRNTYMRRKIRIMEEKKTALEKRKNKQ